MVPPRYERTDSCRRVDRGDGRVVPSWAARPQGLPREFRAGLGCSHPVGDLNDGFVQISEEPVRVGELSDIEEPVS